MIKTEKGHTWITLENGLTISIFNGFGSYTENHYNTDLLIDEPDAASETCEIAVFIKNGEWLTDTFIDCEGDNVKGYIKPDELAEIIYKVKNYKIED